MLYHCIILVFCEKKYVSRIIHTVGPRYNEKYRNAAENALHGCYRSCMRIVKEEKLESIAFCCIYSRRKGYPREDAAHVAIRMVYVNII